MRRYALCLSEDPGAPMAKATTICSVGLDLLSIHDTCSQAKRIIMRVKASHATALCWCRPSIVTVAKEAHATHESFSTHVLALNVCIWLIWIYPAPGRGGKWNERLFSENLSHYSINFLVWLLPVLEGSPGVRGQI
jgi:hypothetical protein